MWPKRKDSKNLVHFECQKCNLEDWLARNCRNIGKGLVSNIMCSFCFVCRVWDAWLLAFHAVISHFECCQFEFGLASFAIKTG